MRYREKSAIALSPLSRILVKLARQGLYWITSAHRLRQTGKSLSRPVPKRSCIQDPMLWSEISLFAVSRCWSRSFFLYPSIPISRTVQFRCNLLNELPSDHNRLNLRLQTGQTGQSRRRNHINHGLPRHILRGLSANQLGLTQSYVPVHAASTQLARLPK